MDPIRELPYWPAAMALLIEAGQMTASDYVPTYPNLPLASEGASTDASRESTQSRLTGNTENCAIGIKKLRDRKSHAFLWSDHLLPGCPR
jgi:hypothetical protein